MAQVEQIGGLPEEIWKEILLKLWLNEEDLEHVLICRKVCRLWEKLVDEMPPKPYWNPWLQHRLDDFRTVHHLFATVIHSDTDISNFLSGNFLHPFRNHTLSVFTEDVKKDEKDLIKLIENHGHHVWKFLYRPGEDVPQTLINFPHLLTHMKNIRTLLLDCNYLSTKNVMGIVGKNFPTDLNNLNELVLRENCNFGNIGNDDDKMCSKLSVNYGSQFKRLTFDMWGLHLNRSKIMERFPNLEDLRIECRSVHSDVVLPTTAKQLPKLKRLALVTREPRWGSSALKSMLNIAGCFAETLQLLSLEKEFDFSLNEALCKSHHTNDPVVIIAFPKLTQLIIPFWFICHLGRPTNIPLETSFRVSLPNLKLLVLEDTYDEFKNRDLGGAELEEICAPFWPLVPSSVETISVRSEKTNQVLYQDFPAVYQCNRKEA